MKLYGTIALAECNNTTCAPPMEWIILVVQGRISRLNKNPNTYSGCSKVPGYAYNMLKRRRKLLKKGYRFDTKIRGWVRK